jgi:hypothetical protein
MNARSDEALAFRHARGTPPWDDEHPLCRLLSS